MNKIARDKWKHFYVGIAMGIVLQLVFGWLFPGHHIKASICALILVIIISYGFELFSLITGLGVYGVMDAVAGTIGGLAGMAVILRFQLHLFR